MKARKYPTEWVVEPIRKDWAHCLRYEVDVSCSCVRIYVLGVQQRKLSRAHTEIGEYQHPITTIWANSGECCIDSRLMEATKQLHGLMESAAWREWYHQLPQEEQERLYPAKKRGE
jgi:hypothetical protein